MSLFDSLKTLYPWPHIPKEVIGLTKCPLLLPVCRLTCDTPCAAGPSKSDCHATALVFPRSWCPVDGRRSLSSVNYSLLFFQRILPTQLPALYYSRSLYSSWSSLFFFLIHHISFFVTRPINKELCSEI